MDPQQPSAAKKSKAAEQSRFYRFVNLIAGKIDSSPFDSILIVRGWKKRKKKTMKKAITSLLYLLILILTFIFLLPFSNQQFFLFHSTFHISFVFNNYIKKKRYNVLSAKKTFKNNMLI